MKIRYVDGIAWSGGTISTYVILLDALLTEHSIIPAPTLYLIHLAQAGHLRNSIRASAQDLRSYFAALAEHGKDWRLVTDRDMSGYLYGHLATRRSCTDKSINRHKSTLKSFYERAWQTGLLNAPTKYTYSYLSTELKALGNGKKKVNFDLYNKYVEKDIFGTLLSNVIAQAPLFVAADRKLTH